MECWEELEVVASLVLERDAVVLDRMELLA